MRNAVLRILGGTSLFLGLVGLLLTIPFLYTDVMQALVVLTFSVLLIAIGYELRRLSRPLVLPPWLRVPLHALVRALLFVGTAGADFPHERSSRDSDPPRDR